MQVSMNIDIGIRDIRQLTGFIKGEYGVDFTEYSLTSFKRRVEGFLIANKYSLDTLFKHLESKEFLDHFLGCIAVDDTEMFRDPTFWILLKNNYLANIIKEQPKARIWLPMCGSGEEFYSLAILLKECGWSARTEVFVSSASAETLESIRQGYLKNEKLDISTKNYSRFQGTGQLSDYFKQTDNNIAFDRSLFANTCFFKEGLEFNREQPPMHLILFRNKLIYFNPTLQYRVLDLLHGKLASKGLLVLGILEEIELNINSKYSVLDKEESIYQRRN